MELKSRATRVNSFALPRTFRITCSLHSEISGRHSGRFEARLDGQLVCLSSQPLLDAARVLLDELDPDVVLELQHAGSPTWALRGRLGDLAALTVKERDRGGLRLEPWNAFSRSPAGPPIGFDGAEVVEQPPAREIAPTGGPEADPASSVA